MMPAPPVTRPPWPLAEARRDDGTRVYVCTLCGAESEKPDHDYGRCKFQRDAIARDQYEQRGCECGG